MTVGELTERMRIMQPVGTTNPDTGGQVPGTPIVIAEVRGLIVPRAGTEAFSSAQGLISQDLGIVNTATHLVTLWFRPDVSVGQFIEYDDAKRQLTRQFEITQVASPEERGRWLVLACIERVH
jgi:Bacteriophage head-tail adaptor